MDEIIYIITGITGYVGNVIAKRLLEENKHVIGLARSKEKIRKVFKKDYENLEIVYGDIRSKEDIAKLFKYENKKYVVIHLVAYVTIGEGDKETLYSITLGGTKNIVDESFAQIEQANSLPSRSSPTQPISKVTNSSMFLSTIEAPCPTSS